YNLEGKIIEVNKMPSDINMIKVYDNKVFAYNDNKIYMLHSSKADKIYEDQEETIMDFVLKGNSISILSQDKLIKGQIK
ncbi:MAG: hypothetical protein ACERLG_03800, partial [Sedimentibacter sp.]